MSAVKKYAYIDALRGYAVLLVITCHAGGMFSELPYPLKKITNFGWHGVQLFFLMSCVTLMMSWESDRIKGTVSTAHFLVRRLFRIAPMYFLAALLYYIIEPPESGFDIWQLLASMFFVNSWYPTLIPTVPGHWMVVPGGWSVGVEFGFYMIFPIIVKFVRSMRRALTFTLLAIILGCVANSVVKVPLTEMFGPVAAGNFLYFWFPNQLPVFALGTVLYFALINTTPNPASLWASLSKKYGNFAIIICGILMLCAANLPFAQSLPFSGPLLIPALYVASLLFVVIIIVLANHPRSIFVNRFMCLFGKISFSAYLLHFAVLHKLPLMLPSVFDVHAIGVHAIAVWAGLWIASIAITYGLSFMTFNFIELPMMRAGKLLSVNDRIKDRSQTAQAIS